MAAAALSAKVAIRKVQEKRRRAYEESIMTPEQRRARDLEQAKRKQAREEQLREEKIKLYASLSVFPHHNKIIVSTPLQPFTAYFVNYLS